MSDPVEVLHLDAHTGHACFFSDPTCCPYYDQALDTLDALDKGGYEVVPRLSASSAQERDK